MPSFLTRSRHETSDGIVKPHVPLARQRHFYKAQLTGQEGAWAMGGEKCVCPEKSQFIAFPEQCDKN